MAQGSNHFLTAEIRSLLTAGFTLGLLMGGFAGDATAQGGQTEVKKTVPSTPAPAPAPAAQPEAPASAPAPQAVEAQQAQQPAEPAATDQAQPASPVGSGAAWQVDVAAQPDAATVEQDPSALEIVQKVNDYFNAMTTLQGDFVQTDPDNKQKRGKFYFERPGKVRFDYASPSRLVIVSNGEYLAIEDHDLKTTDRYPLQMTPFRLLLAEKVDLVQDARILAVDQGPDTIVLTVEDKKGDSPGRIRLFFNREDMSLSQWIITDPQGLDTRIELTQTETGKEVAANLFQFSKNLGFKNLSQ